MAAFINTNTASLNSQRNLSSSQTSLTNSLQRLSSGLRVNSAKDDAAGLSIATKMDTQVRGMSQAIRNANDGISLAQTADGALSTATEAMQRMRELAVQAANGTNASEDSTNLTKEFDALASEVTRLATDTKFNGKQILATSGTAVTIQVGADSGDAIAIGKTDLQGIASTLTGLDLSTASVSLKALDTALASVTGLRADLGATQNRLSYSISNLQSSVENQSAAKSRIMDTDFAAETASMTRGQILQQAGTAMLAQANSLPNGVLSLLRG